MTEPTKPGAQPQVLPADVLGALPQVLVFPQDAIQRLNPPGPVGPKAEDIPAGERPALTSWTKHPRVLRTWSARITATAPPTFNRIEVARPSVLVPFRTTFPNSSPSPFQLEVTFMPEDAVGVVIPGSNHGMVASRGACWLWAAGRWTIALGPNGPNGESVEFLVVPAEDRSVAEMLLRSWEYGTRGTVREVSTTLAAATSTVLLDLDPLIFRDFVRVNNVGANPMRIEFVASASATTGQLIPAGESLEFYGAKLPLARLSGFSTLGTDVTVDTSQRHFNT